MPLTQEQIDLLREKTVKARTLSYSPYSHFKVGCCILIRNNDSSTTDHIIAANVENASYGNTICAERSALIKVITNENSSIQDPTNWIAMGIIGDNPQGFITPCGICRQFIREFIPITGNTPKFPIFLFNHRGEEYKITYIDELLPMSFGPDSL